MTSGPIEQPGRLDRIEAILEQLANRQADANERLTRIEQICESNARALEADTVERQRWQTQFEGGLRSLWDTQTQDASLFGRMLGSVTENQRNMQSFGLEMRSFAQRHTELQQSIESLARDLSRKIDAVLERLSA
ncbi:MAG: hypothetical protein AAF892_01180 [Cyanobacteria bacterium P01_D01_bin.71]